MLIQDEKRVKLLACVDGWGLLEVITARELDSIKGRVLHYSYCIRHLRVLATEIECLLGPVGEADYDRKVAVTGEMRGLAREIRMVVERFSAQGVPLWPPVPSSAYAAFLRGDERQVFFSLTWDASPLGWAALVRWWSADTGSRFLREQLLIGTWPEGEDVAEQAHRECLAASLALEAAGQAVEGNIRLRPIPACITAKRTNEREIDRNSTNK